MTAVITGLAAIWLFDLSTLEGLIIGSAVAATDSAAIFAVLRGSHLRKRLARALEGESGMNDPVALLLVTGFIEWIELPGLRRRRHGRHAGREARARRRRRARGRLAAHWAFRNLDLPSPGLYPVASIATAALAYGVAEVVHGSGFLSVYIAALILGTGPVPARQTTIAFHQGLSWVSQISLFALLGLLVFPSGLGDVAAEGLLLSAALIFVARPLAAVVASAFAPFDMRERLMLGWAGLRGAIPIWLATFPVIAGRRGRRADLQRDLLRRRHLDPDPGGHLRAAREAARRGRRRAGADAAADRDRDHPPARRRVVRLERAAGRRRGRPHDQGPRAAARGAGQPDRPRRRGDPAARLDRDRGRRRAPHRRRGSSSSPRSRRSPSAGATARSAAPRCRRCPPRGAPQVFTVRPWTRSATATRARRRRSRGRRVAAAAARRDGRGSLVLLADGRYAVDRRRAARARRPPPARRVVRAADRRAPGRRRAERAWWQEVAGALSAPATPPDADLGPSRRPAASAIAA